MLKSNFIKKSLGLDLKLKNKPGHRGGGSGCAGYAVTNPWVPSLWWAESIEDWGNIISHKFFIFNAEMSHRPKS